MTIAKRFSTSLLISAGLLVCTICTLSGGVHGQSKRLPPPDFVKAADQPNSPVKLTVEGRDENRGSFNPIFYSIRNVGKKPIRSMVVTGFPKDPNHVIGNRLLQPDGTGSFIHGDLNARKPDEIITLTVDFVLFSDGSKWGADVAGESEFVLGIIDGQALFYKEAKSRLDAERNQAIVEFLAGKHNALAVAPGHTRTRREEGIARGYSYWLHTLRFDIENRGSRDGIASRLEDLGQELGIVRSRTEGQRRISRTFNRNEPVKVVSVSTGTQELAFERDYISTADWLKDLSFKIRNDSKKNIVYLSLNLDFPETTQTGDWMAFQVSYGILPAYPGSGRAGEPPIPPGESFRISLDDSRYASLNRFLETRQSIDILSRLNVTLLSIRYDDGTGWSAGQEMKVDPNDARRMNPAK